MKFKALSINVPSKLCACTQVVRWAHTRKLGVHIRKLGAHVNFSF